MGLYQRLTDAFRSHDFDSLWKERLITWRRTPTLVRVEHPTRLEKARRLGYKAKEGFVLVRVRLNRSKRQRPQIRAGRKSKNMRRKKIVGKSYQWIAEERAAKKYPNCEVLNSYYLAEDGMHRWYEVILVDKNHPAIKTDERINWICERQHTRRAFRGLTAAGHKSRGLLHKGIGAEKLRPSLRANKRRGK